MRTGNIASVVVLLMGVSLHASEPMNKATIDDINDCQFISGDVIAYTTFKGELTLANPKDLMTTIRKTSCSPSGAWLCGAADGIVVVQTSMSVIGYSEKSLKKIYEIAADDAILLTAMSPKKHLIAVFDRSGAVTTFSLGDGKRVGAFAVSRPEYAQSWMRFEFTNKGESIFFFLHSLAKNEHTVTRVVDTITGKLTHSCNDWHTICTEPIEDAALLLQDDAELLLATRTKGVYQANTRKHDAKLLFIPRNAVYKVFSAQIGERCLAFVCADDWCLQIYDIASGQLQDTVTLPKGYVRSFSFSQDRKQLALVVRGEGGDNLVVVDLSIDKDPKALIGK